MKFLTGLAFIIFLMAFQDVRGQVIREFSADSLAYIEELNVFFDRIASKDNKEPAMSALEEFSSIWMAGKFNPVQQHQIYTISNLMLKKRVKAYPYFAVLLQSLSSLKNQGYRDEQMDVWLDGCLKSLEQYRGSKEFKIMMDFSADLLEGNTLYRARQFWWYVSGNTQFTFSSDSAFRVTFKNTNLVCTNQVDSSIIYKTSGSYYPLQFRWYGQSGKITWERAGLDPDKVYARFGDFNISLKSSPYTIEHVNFINPKYFPEPLTGKLTEKISTKLIEPENASYPYFQSNVKDHFIGNIFKDVDYLGGFAMKGANILGEGDEYKAAKLTFKRPYRDKQGKYDLLVARSKSFIIKPSGIRASMAGVTIHHQNDSVFHAGLQFKYMNNNREVSLLRVEKGISESPYFNTFHNLDIDCEALYWKMDDPEIRFRAIMGIQPISEALFISDKYFMEEQYDMLQGLDYTHPLIVIYNYAREYNSNAFYAYQLARFMRMPEQQVELQLIRLAKYGFLFYNSDTKWAVINDKLYHYIDAKSGRADYDVISFFSRVENMDNATLSLDNFDLKIRGVPRVFISDSQNVYIYPTKEEVTLRKNRDFIFSGTIEAGLFTFKARESTFEYDTFKLNLPAIDEMRFKVRAFDDRPGELNFVDVKTVVSNINGKIYIDHPSNKSGLRDFPEYPIFISEGESFVYYNRDSMHNNAYDPERFYFKLEPFTINRLADYSNKSLSFGGYLNSAGIFPENITDGLVVMPDYSMGFKVATPPQGYPIYGGKGIFTDSISLSNRGLRASGKLKYLNTNSEGRDLLLYPDSALGVFDNFVLSKRNTPDPGFPEVKGKNMKVNWLPYNDSMSLATTDTLASLYNNRARLNGALVFTPSVLTGSGRLDFFSAMARSSNYLFGFDYFKSDSMKIRIRNLNEEEVAFSTDNFAGNVSFEQNIGNFSATENSTEINFPLNRFSAGMDAFDWFINDHVIKLTSFQRNEKVDASSLSLREIMDVTPDGTKLISLHPLQDSLQFYAPEATFNLRDTTLLAEDVKLIKVADAAIFPGDGRVEIKATAKISRLENAIIIADTLDKTHMITDASVKIESRYSYKAKGSYAYTNLTDDIQIIEFDKIEVDTSYHTIAEGEILPAQEFLFSPQFTFMGDVSLNAGNPLLLFDGSYQLIQDCNPAFTRWVNFKGRINPDSIAFPVPKQPEEYGGGKVYVGIFHSNETNRVYPAFLSPRNYYSDTLMMTARGAITTRKKGTEFLIAAPDEIMLNDNMYPSGPYMTMNTDACKISASGPISFATDFGKVKMEAFGQAEHFIIPDSTIFQTFLTLDFFFNEKALEYLAESLRTANVKGAEIAGPVQKVAYRQLLGEVESKKFVFEMNSFGEPRNLPESLNKSLVISNVKLNYYPDSRSFISEGPISIGLVGGEPVNKTFDGYLEIVRKRSGDMFQLYLEIDRRHWYFFSHMGNLMQTISAKNEYNLLITDEDANDRKQKAEKNETEYRYIISTNSKKNRFLRSIRSLKGEEGKE